MVCGKRAIFSLHQASNRRASERWVNLSWLPRERRTIKKYVMREREGEREREEMKRGTGGRD
jgi:hypothetical protein